MTTQEESFVIIGTKQPDLEDVKKKDLNNYLPLWKQEVIIIDIKLFFNKFNIIIISLQINIIIKQI